MWKDSETKIDLLDFDYLTKILVDIITNEKLSPSSIGVYGDWGSGKSSLMQLTMDELTKDKDILCIKFNGWLFEGYEDAKSAILGNIIDEIKKQRTLSSKGKDIVSNLYKSIDKFKLASKGLKYGVDFLITGGLGSIADITINSVLSKLKDKATDVTGEDITGLLEQEFKSEEIRNSIRSFNKDFIELLDETKLTKLAVFIDELDRCNSETILETFEAIRLFIFVEKTSFIIGADERHVTYAVRKKYPEIEGKQIDIGKEYLEKIIQYPVRIPPLGQKEVEFYMMCLFFQEELSENEFNELLIFITTEKSKNFLEFELKYNELKEQLPEIADKCKNSISLSKQLSSVLAAHLNGNPRHCKRFLNTLSMREKMASYRNVSLDRKVLSKLMLLEYIKSDFFRKIANLQSLENGMPREIALIEDQKWDDVEALKLWKDDPWIIKLMNLEPQLKDVDLRPYFYFSRESLTSQLNLGHQRISPEAEKILVNLLSGADSERKSALKQSNGINDMESIIILEHISDKILSDSKIDTKIFRSLLEWGASKEILISSTISFLNELHGDKLNISILPRVKAFMEETKKIVEVRGVVKRWETENSKLSAAIIKDFGEDC